MNIPALAQHIHTLEVRTNGKGFCEINAELADWIKKVKAKDGLLTLFIRHTSASLTIQENADPDVVQDLADSLEQFAPQGSYYRHSSEGPDDMPSHIKSMLTATQLAVPVVKSRLALGTWQGVFVIEHRASPHTRNIVLHYLGTCL